MAYVLQGIIASPQALAACRAYANGVVAGLGQGLGLMPMTPALFDEVRQSGEIDPRFASARMFPAGFEVVLAEWSATGPVAYVEAEYFAGTGSQLAAVWRDGTVVLGPLVHAEDEPSPAAGWSPISQALRRLGVSPDGYRDEFDAIHLSRHRRTEGWIMDQPSP